MRRGSRTLLAALVAVACATEGAACTRETARPQDRPAAAAPDFAAALRDGVGADAMLAHLDRLQRIADANGGNRALGTPGFAASADYVAGVLRDKGFDVQATEFEVRVPFANEPVVTVGGQRVRASPINYTVGTGAAGLSGRLVPARGGPRPGCASADYDGLDVTGAVVLVDRGACPFGDKQTVAAERGAVALIVANDVDGELRGATLGEDTDVTIPAVGITKADGARLRANPAAATVTLDAGVRVEETHNLVAQTKTGSPRNVVMVGAHLDSVPAGPGIDDNGSGVAAVLETAVQLGSSPQVQNAVRFAFWAAEEEGVIGSTRYVQGLGVEALKDIALYLNVDMIASPNPGYFTYDGDQSAPPSPVPPRVPEGSAGLERTLAQYLAAAGKPPRDTSFDGRSDYDAFTKAGIPSGGLFSGAEDEMSADEAALWGGTAGAPFDPNYHAKSDRYDQLDRTSLEIHGKGLAYAIGLYAQDQGGRNGVPVRDDRTRHVVTAS
ncbi:M20/M25/M40 family metallo-hydrolase [Mycolicibacterium madagascariense]|uniref:M20/M25/M40 family metallo-hydrolase n=1 Tax=Mycolicibacterium madagascariense TaxID=212765 RepID=UPI0013D4FABE|nr:M20/M25/M40 family metallo-hydrolase [Mycolicibacterium madagascariense]MCV7014756.1 M20/M25/M40 family metallo-hydrolase [Mycolicibacterium madagascariense]